MCITTRYCVRVRVRVAIYCKIIYNLLYSLFIVQGFKSCADLHMRKNIIAEISGTNHSY